MNKKPKIGIFDLTDCEGCEVEILSLGEKLLDFTNQVEIINWRLIKENIPLDKYDIALIEGSVITQADQDLVKSLRDKTKIIVAIGACASTGGIPALIKEEDRQKFTQKIYGNYYHALAKDAKPLDHYIKIDYYLPGCPINPNELEDLLVSLVNKQKIESKFYPVCYECKIKENKCLLLDGQSCLGPITRGGCGARCTSNGVKCYGCWGATDQANFMAMITILANQNRPKKEISQILEMFMEENEEIRKLLK